MSFFYIFDVIKRIKNCMKKANLILLFILINTFSWAQTWSDEGKATFIKSCMADTIDGISRENHFLYCESIMGELITLYPDESTVGEITEEQMNELARKHFGQALEIDQKEASEDLNPTVWTDYVKKAFTINCRMNLMDYYVNSADYCNCTLEKIMKLSPNPQNLEKINQKKLLTIANDCSTILFR